jgi:hypothetical protein
VVGFVGFADFGGAAQDAELFTQLVYDGSAALGEAFEADEFLDSGEVYLVGAEAVEEFFEGRDFEVPEQFADDRVVWAQTQVPEAPLKDSSSAFYGLFALLFEIFPDFLAGSGGFDDFELLFGGFGALAGDDFYLVCILKFIA